jgi:hypothetical protein
VLDVATGELLWKESDEAATVSQDVATGKGDEMPAPTLVADHRAGAGSLCLASRRFWWHPSFWSGTGLELG